MPDALDLLQQFAKGVKRPTYRYKGYTIVRLSFPGYEIAKGPKVQAIRGRVYTTIADAKWAITKLVEERAQADKEAWREEFLHKTA
jgi:hypothetical protein